MTTQDRSSEHYFEFSRDFAGGERLCGTCRLTCDEGPHIEITTLQPYTHYVCPEGHGGLGHSSVYTGAYLPSLRTVRDHLCACGAEFVKEDDETWQLSWEMRDAAEEAWRSHSVIRTRHAAESQRDGLLALAASGEQIRSVVLTELVPAAGAHRAAATKARSES